MKSNVNTVSMLKKDIVACCRILDGKGLVEAYGHVSAKIPNTNRILITPRVAPALVRAEDILTIDYHGATIEGEGQLPIEYHLHTAVYNRRSDVQAICRTHPTYAGILATIGERFRVLYGFGAFLGPRVPIDHKLELVTHKKRGEEVAYKLGRASAVILRGNGAISAGGSLKEALTKVIFLELAAEMQYKAILAGTPIYYTSNEIRERVNQARYDHYERVWNYYVEKYTRKQTV